MTDFDPAAIRRFRFGTCDFDPATGIARLGYAFDDGPEMIETLTFPGAPFADALPDFQALERASRLEGPTAATRARWGRRSMRRPSPRHRSRAAAAVRSP